MKVLQRLKSFFAFLLWASVPKFDVSNVKGNALIKLSSIGITNLSGKAGGSVYAHNRGGSYVRNFAVPSNPQTAAQSAARAAFGAWASAWRSLDESARNAWREAAANFPYVDRFGDSRTMSGENLYISLNRNLQVISASQIKTPPMPAGVDGVVSTDAAMELVLGGESISSAGMSATLAGNDKATTMFAIYCTGALSAGVNYFKNKLIFISSMSESAVSSPTNPAFITAFTNKLGVPPVGSKIGIRIDPINQATGERGASIFTSLVVTEAEA